MKSNTIIMRNQLCYYRVDNSQNNYAEWKKLNIKEYTA